MKFSLLFRFVFASFHFRFASDVKTSEKDFFRIKVKKISLPFRFILLRSENDGSFRFFRFVFASFHFCFAFYFYVSHRCETAHPTFLIKEVQPSLHMRRPALEPLHYLESRGRHPLFFPWSASASPLFRNSASASRWSATAGALPLFFSVVRIH